LDAAGTAVGLGHPDALLTPVAIALLHAGAIWRLCWRTCHAQVDVCDKGHAASLRVMQTPCITPAGARCRLRMNGILKLRACCCCRRLYGELLQRDEQLLHTQQQLQQLRGSVHGLLSGLQVRRC
jgi:hypothetical protein